MCVCEWSLIENWKPNHTYRCPWKNNQSIYCVIIIIIIIRVWNENMLEVEEAEKGLSKSERKKIMRWHVWTNRERKIGSN